MEQKERSKGQRDSHQQSYEDDQYEDHLTNGIHFKFLSLLSLFCCNENLVDIFIEQYVRSPINLLKVVLMQVYCLTFFFY